MMIVPTLPKKKKPKRSITLRIDQELSQLVKGEIERQGITLVAAVEYGLQRFLEASQTKGKK